MAVKLHRQKNSVENAPVIKPSSTIWIGGLPFKTSDADIHERFGSFGSISNVRFTERYDGKPTGMCYVTYSAPEAAEAAAASMNKATFGSRYVHVKLHFDQGTIKPSRKADDQVKTIRQDQVNRVYFGNIPFTTTETELAETFASCGDLKDVLIYRDKNQRSRGHGYVQFKDAGSAAAAVRDLHGTIVGGREMSVEVPKAMRAAVAAVATSTTVRVTNLPVDLENDTLRSMFDHCGAISHLRRASDNQSALLVFDSPEGAQEAQGLAGADIEGRVIHVQLTEEKDE
ncbi:hypothetical protein DYB32_006754 [Aphanomyces invadans]|uniref:RRM domain-containing protein n=1 Tax=Aphanomyces invadans TaxID=157072 RepID=A0A418AQP1_9STRA|nr:hypothetical protein DYB32_006754 [Aphanomyces invadans]